MTYEHMRTLADRASVAYKGMLAQPALTADERDVLARVAAYRDSLRAKADALELAEYEAAEAFIG